MAGDLSRNTEQPGNFETMSIESSCRAFLHGCSVALAIQIVLPRPAVLALTVRLVSVFLVLIPISAAAQYPLRSLLEGGTAGNGEQAEDEIVTDRDSFTPSTSTVGRQRLMVESAYSMIDNRHVPETHSLPELVVRYGASDWLELRFGTNYEIGGTGNPVSANIPDNLDEEPGLEEESNVSYGLKIALLEQDDWIPEVAAMVQAFTPTAGEATATQMAVTYVSGWTFANGWTWDSALRYSTGSLEEDQFNVWSPSTVLKVPVGERWNAHIEYFGIFSDGRDRESAQYYVSPGVHYLITRDWELGVRLGAGLNDQSANFFTNVGGGYRF